MDHAIGIVIQNRWKTTKATLRSLQKASQSGYDLFLVDNGSEDVNVSRLCDFVDKSRLPVKQLFLLDEVPMSKAFNLFLHQSQNYVTRTKMDNDIGIYHQDRKFLRRIRRTMKKRKYDICSALPVNLNWQPHLIKLFREECEHRIALGHAYLFAACMMISKPCFKKLGYFDERLWRRIDIDYCHRARLANLAFGYADDYWVVHLGERTENKKLAKQRLTDAAKFNRIRTLYRKTEWENVSTERVVDLRAK